MSTSIHPHWDETDENDNVVRVRDACEPTLQAVEEVPAHTTTISRRPAAIFGILFVMGIGTAFVYGVDNLTGQLSGNTDVTITDQGTEPSTITKAAGEDIVWINQQETPHYLSSKELCAGSGDCLNTVTMFPGDRASYTIPLGTVAGSYAYESGTDPLVTGTIVVTDGGSNSSAPKKKQPKQPMQPKGDEELIEQPDLTPPTESVDDDFGNIPPPPLPLSGNFGEFPPDSRQNAFPPPPKPPTPEPDANIESEVAKALVAEETDDEGEVVDQALLDAIQEQLALDGGIRDNGNGDFPDVSASVTGIPHNPYTVDSNFAQPNVPNPAPPTFNQGTQKPFKQPETGPGVWVVIALSTALLLLLTRHSLKAYI